MSLWAGVPFIFFEFRNLELRWYHDIGDQTEFMRILTEQIFASEGSHLLLHLFKFSFEPFSKIVHLVATNYTVRVVDLFVLLIGDSVSQWCSIGYCRRQLRDSNMVRHRDLLLSSGG